MQAVLDINESAHWTVLDINERELSVLDINESDESASAVLGGQAYMKSDWASGSGYK